MFKGSIEVCSNEGLFLRQALGEGIRLDGRLPGEYRDVELSLYRGESSSSAEVQIGDTRVFCAVHGQITSPYPDRPTEGMLQFGAELSMGAETSAGQQLSQVDIVRLLERCIRESEAIDTESLCIVGGEKVWLISCEVRVLDFSGNVLDASLLAAMGALRAFRKPEISIVGKSSSLSGQVIIHSADEREPLPLALHHTPLAVSVGIFKGIVSAEEGSEDEPAPSMCVLLGDPSLGEERAMDGSIVFSINAHDELCAVHKPGGVAVSVETVLQAARMATARAKTLHEVLASALAILDADVERDRDERIRIMRSASAANKTDQVLDMVVEAQAQAQAQAQATVDLGSGGIDRNDPVLSWSLLHKAAVSE